MLEDMQPLAERDLAAVLGLLCAGNEVTDEERKAAQRSLRGAVETADQGRRIYYVQVDTCALDNTDAEEAIWSTGDDGIVRGLDAQVIADLADEDSAYAAGILPLIWLSQPEPMARSAMRWSTDSDPERRTAWTALQQQIAEPLRFLLQDD